MTKRVNRRPLTKAEYSGNPLRYWVKNIKRNVPAKTPGVLLAPPTTTMVRSVIDWDQWNICGLTVPFKWA